MFDRNLMKCPRVYGAASNTIYVWTLEAGSSKLDASLQGHHSAVTSLEITQDNTHLVRYTGIFLVLGISGTYKVSCHIILEY